MTARPERREERRGRSDDADADDDKVVVLGGRYQGRSSELYSKGMRVGKFGYIL